MARRTKNRNTNKSTLRTRSYPDGQEYYRGPTNADRGVQAAEAFILATRATRGNPPRVAYSGSTLYGTGPLTSSPRPRRRPQTSRARNRPSR